MPSLLSLVSPSALLLLDVMIDKRQDYLPLSITRGASLLMIEGWERERSWSLR